MGRNAKPAKAKVEARLPVRGNAPKNEDAKVRDLENRLAESLKREAEALEQQTATAEILRVIASSPTDVQPVLDAVAESATRLCAAIDAVIFRLGGDVLCRAAHSGPIPAPPGFVIPATRSRVTGRAVLDRQPVQIADAQAESQEFLETQAFAREHGFRTILSVPLLREGVAIGTIDLRRTEVQPFTDSQIALLQTFANQAVIAIENVRLFTELQGKNRALTESLEQQTATSEILRVISSSPTDVAPVFATIIRSAVQLSGARRGALLRFDGELVHLVAHHNQPAEALASLERAYPMRPSRMQVSGRAILSRAVAEIYDVRNDPEYLPGMAAEWELGSVLGVPMLRADGTPTGVIAIQRSESGPFAAGHVELLKTFADQAVIAIENVRLFTELESRNRELRVALEQQTATSEILRVISSSPMDVQPIFDAIVRSASRLCGGEWAIVTRYDGELLHLAAQHNPRPGAADATSSFFPHVPRRETSIPARALIDAAVVHISDIETETEDLEPSAREQYRRIRLRAVVAVPMVHEGRPIGVVSASRGTPAPFSDRQIDLLRTFADQAVIAIENVRLFKELRASNDDLTDALQQQTATGEILRVISQSPTDVQPVFDAIVESAVTLCDGLFGGLVRFDGELIYQVATHNYTPEALDALRRIFPARPSRTLGVGRAILDRDVVHLPDVRLDPEYQVGDLADAIGFRSGLFVPMLRDRVPIGAILVARAEPGPFSGSEIALLKTFADQAVIAIENVRLFKELESRNAALTEALNQQTATAEILGVLSASPTQVQPVFDAIVASAVRLCDGVHGAILRVDGDTIDHVAQFGHETAVLEEIRRHFPQPIDDAAPSSPLRAIRERRVVEVTDTETTPGVPDFIREAARRQGFRSELWVPMLHGENAIGTIVVTRREPGRFTDKQIALLQTFADQAVIAIENVRLFNETKEALDQQTATSEILRVISTSPTDVQPVFDAIVRNAANVCGAFDAVLALAEGDDFVTPAHHGPIPRPTGNISMQGTVTGQAIREARTVHVADLLAADHYPIGRELASEIGYRTVLCVPLLHDGASIGAIGIRRTEVRPFTDKQIALLKTFADQAVIAIENVRLFKELQSSNRELMTALDQQTATSEVLRTIAHTKTDPQPVFDTILRSAVRLCHAAMAAVSLTDGRMLYLPANYGSSPEAMAAVRARFPRPLDMETATGTAILTRAVIHEPDVQEPSVAEFTRQSGRVLGFRSLLSVPMLRQGEAVGAINVTRREPGPFSEAEVALLKTFADQAVIAVENVRLFTELEGANRELSAASQHKSEFLANMSHELRTPLNAIIGFSEVLGERLFGDLNDKQEEYLKDIHASGQHLLSLINDILDLSKIEAGRMELELTDCHLPTALGNALTLVRERAGRRGIALNMTTDERLEYVRADERKIKQVLLNLLSNAIKFTPDGGRIDVRAIVGDGSVEVSVSDTGVGIAPADQEAIFEEFRQVGTADKKVEGTGLGLALSRKFIELHGGRIWVESEPGAGSTFTFTLPRGPA
jgi:GAF domain-containing protein/anti-sigma regulatory factor (Ser/Thr protein kinase)